MVPIQPSRSGKREPFLNTQNPFIMPHPNRFNELKELLQSYEAEFQKFYEKDNKAAGTRIRKGMRDLRDLAQEIRVEVQKIKNEAGTAAE